MEQVRRKKEQKERLKKRWALMGVALLITGAIIGFLFIVNLSQPESARRTLNLSLFITGGAAAAALGAFIFWGEIFDDGLHVHQNGVEDGAGKMLKNSILFMMIAVICIVQLTLFFATFSFRLMDFNRESLAKSRELFEVIQDGGGELDESQIKLPDEIQRIYITDDGAAVNPTEAYRFPMGDSTVVMEISRQYQQQVVLKILVDLVTVLAASIILTVELVIFALKFIEDRFGEKAAGSKAGTAAEAAAGTVAETVAEAAVRVSGMTAPEQEAGAETEAGTGIKTNTGTALPHEYRMVSYVRQIAFLFYFASRMGTPFIALLAKKLGGSFLGLSENVLAGIPQSAEFLFTCVAIFLTSLMIEKRGWKLPFAGGLFIVAVGTVASALAPDLAWFILARSIVGVGYGFCWMTLRNFALFASTGEEKALCFALLNAGIYAGMNCGAVMGSILAEIIGYVPVLLLSSGLTALCALPILKLENARYVRPAEEEEEKTRQRMTLPDLWQMGLFMVLLIIPSCILGSYLGYYLPIYFTDQGGTVSDVGRAQLIYGLIIVYLGPAMVRVMQRFYVVRRWSVLYNLVFASGLLMFGLMGGMLPAMAAMAVIGMADAFGFVAQNNYFLDMKVARKLGHSRALSCISIIKKLAEMLGPIVFGFLFAFPGTSGVAVLGGVFFAAAIAYVMLERMSVRHETEKAGT